MSDRARYWQRLVAAWQKSGLRQAEFCRRRKVKAVTFAWWKRRLKGPAKPTRRHEGPSGGRPDKHKRAGFVELALPARTLAVGSTRSMATPALDIGAFGYEIALTSGRVIRLPHRFDPAVVAELVRAVESC
jgi:hypothetical protein